MKKEALDSNVWRTHFGRRHGPVVQYVMTMMMTTDNYYMRCPRSEDITFLSFTNAYTVATSQNRSSKICTEP